MSFRVHPRCSTCQDFIPFKNEPYSFVWTSYFLFAIETETYSTAQAGLKCTVKSLWQSYQSFSGWEYSSLDRILKTLSVELATVTEALVGLLPAGHW